MDSEADTKWFVLGLIPTTEDVLYGLTSLNEWHQPVSIHGYMVATEGAGSNAVGELKSWHGATNECSLKVESNTNREDLYVLVTGITLEEATVSANGEADDEWVQGDVPFLGRGGFIMFFLVGGIGGSVGLFIVSKGMIMKSAGRSMRILIGEEGMKKAASVKKDAKAANAAGMESPEERQRRKDRERREAEKERRQAEKKKDASAEKASKKKDEGALGGFDLDSVLASTSTSGPGRSAPTGRKSSVVATEAAEEMDRMSAQQETATTSSLPASFSQQRRVHRQRRHGRATRRGAQQAGSTAKGREEAPPNLQKSVLRLLSSTMRTRISLISRSDPPSSSRSLALIGRHEISCVFEHRHVQWC